MTRIIVDELLRKRLNNLAQPLELCDESGQVLARLIPLLDSCRYNLEPQISREEIRRRMQTKEKSYTTAEGLAHLLPRPERISTTDNTDNTDKNTGICNAG